MENLTNPAEPSRDDAGNRSRPSRRASSIARSVAGLHNRRRGLIVAGAVTLCGVVAVPVVAVALSSHSHPALVTTAAGDRTPIGPVQTGAAPQATATTEAPSTTAAPPPTTAAPAVTARPAPTTTTTLVCHDSYNPACGPFRWASPPSPAGSPTVTIEFRPSNPVAGDTVTFTVHYSDPDTGVAPCGSVQTGTPMNSGCSVDYASCPTRYGPWDPPAKHPGSNTLTYPVRYDSAGKYTFSVDYAVGNSCYDPYKGHATGSVTVVIGSAPSSSS